MKKNIERKELRRKIEIKQNYRNAKEVMNKKNRVEK